MLRWSPRSRRSPLLLLAALVLGCTPLGLMRGDYWTGISTGDLGACPSFDFAEVVIEEGRLGGWAQTEHPWGTTIWQLRGLVASGGQVTLDTSTTDPRVARQSLKWTGTYNPIFWEILETPAQAGCPKPRAAKLQRK